MADRQDSLSTEPYKGVRDFYPNDWARLQSLFSTARKTLTLWGYEEYNASPLERAELYESKTSEEIVNEQTYTFTDRGDRKVTLRPEMTPSLARMVASKRREIPFPLRWFSIGNRFRYERPQRGRLREFYQVDVDLVGLPGGAADTEIVRLASALMAGFGAKESDYTIRVNSRDLLNAACAASGITGEAVREYLHLLDRKAKMTTEEFIAAAKALGDNDPLQVIENPETALHVEKEKKRINDLISELHSLGATNVVFDPTITRGFDYYTGIVFEVFDTDTANARSLFGGGRYDGLVALFGGDPIPAVGFAFGDVVLTDFLETHGLLSASNTTSPTVYVGTPTPDDVAAAQTCANKLRGAGIRTFVNLTDKSLGDQVKDALKREIPYFVAYGKDEVASGSVRLKTLATSDESVVTLDELAKHIKQSA